MQEQQSETELAPWALPGRHIWKSGAEYSTVPALHGTPYWQITQKGDWEITKPKEKGLYFLWELSEGSEKYHLRRASADFDSLVEEGWALDRKKTEERWEKSPYRFR